MSETLIADLREHVRILQRAAGSAQVLLAGVVDSTYGSTKTINLGRVLGALIAAEEAAAEAVARITDAATAAGAREKAAVARG
jgi:hypothetical protein